MTKAQPMPAPEALTVIATYDKKAKNWEASVCEGRLEQFVLNETFESEDATKAAAEKWLAQYAKVNDAGRRKLLGWKPVKGSKATPTTEVSEQKAKDSKEPKAPKETKPKKESTRGPSGLTVAAQMLKDVGTPMKCKDMVEEMIAKRLWTTNGKTPSATIYAAIIREIAEKGKEARFKKTDRGSFEFNLASAK